MTYTISKETTFAAAHHLPGHPGECRRLHGHNYRLRVQVSADRLDEHGMVVDFGCLKALIGEVAGRFDHQLLNDVPPFDDRSPTAEQLSEHFFQVLAERLPALVGDGRRVVIRRVEVWENDTSCAVFEP